MRRGVLITGSAVGIGASLVEAFADAGWNVVGVDIAEPDDKARAAATIKADIADFCDDQAKLERFANEVRRALNDAPLAALVNNAAVQILGGVEELSVSDFVRTMRVNAIAPFALVKAFQKDLEATNGAVINIGSVHAQATKPEFAAYATSKAALHGLTRALAVALGSKIRVNTLAPAATATEMLKAGFENDEEGLANLADVHPLKRLAAPEEIARIALFLASKDASFMSGATIFADGGVLSRLHDPA